ncbi:hypothetical protein Cni_G09685 [Canna indica]|uniref:RING-type domain-containing protein n=1 Tax=Canna indica TaxID=4628 RepID=A0AAQ3K318_9LILI|nr:hypothetical protein Cni_G09685 [Canna indica]
MFVASYLLLLCLLRSPLSYILLSARSIASGDPCIRHEEVQALPLASSISWHEEVQAALPASSLCLLIFSGLDQAFINALPLFLYSEILGSKESFDCVICLCEFSPNDKLRLLPICGHVFHLGYSLTFRLGYDHAFHLGCINTWLFSNSTCPLCRGVILVQGLAIENPVFALDDSRGEEEEMQLEN